tara:strand:- start:2198 stop:2560 length:363 start_codon:yes stop_codon:yes gene_type:complete
MAYVSQEKKKELAVGIKKVLKKYKMKGTIAVNNHSTLVVNLKSGVIDFKAQNEHYQVNPYHIENQWTGVAKDFLVELLAAMKGDDWFDKSDIMTDYFHVAWYNDINIGKWNKAYELTEAA